MAKHQIRVSLVAVSSGRLEPRDPHVALSIYNFEVGPPPPASVLSQPSSAILSHSPHHNHPFSIAHISRWKPRAATIPFVSSCPGSDDSPVTDPRKTSKTFQCLSDRVRSLITKALPTKIPSTPVPTIHKIAFNHTAQTLLLRRMGNTTIPCPSSDRKRAPTMPLLTTPLHQQ